jgi:hypothetical protein
MCNKNSSSAKLPPLLHPPPLPKPVLEVKMRVAASTSLTLLHSAVAALHPEAAQGAIKRRLRRLQQRLQPALVAVVTWVTLIFFVTMHSSSSFARLSSNNLRCWSLFSSSSVLATLSSPNSLLLIPTSSSSCWARK